MLKRQGVAANVHEGCWVEHVATDGVVALRHLQRGRLSQGVPFPDLRP